MKEEKEKISALKIFNKKRKSFIFIHTVQHLKKNLSHKSLRLKEGKILSINASLKVIDLNVIVIFFFSSQRKDA